MVSPEFNEISMVSPELRRPRNYARLMARKSVFGNRSRPCSTQNWSRGCGAVGDDGLAKVVQDGSVLQAQRLHDGQDAFGEAAARFAVVAETYFPPDHRTAKRKRTDRLVGSAERRFFDS